MRRLVINADDFGLTAGVNRAILEAHTAGVVTSATLMANAHAFGDAVRLAHAAPRLSVGCHVVLVDGEPVNSHASGAANTLARNGRFRDGAWSFAWAAVRGQLDASEIAEEVTAQIRRIQEAGLIVSHIDSHKHTHLWPAVYRPLLRAAREAGVRAVRNPFVPVRPLAFAHLIRRPRLWTRYSEFRLLRRYSAAFLREVEQLDMVTTEGTFGAVVTGMLDRALLETILGSLPEGTWELVCHPGYNDAELDGVRTRLRESRDVERLMMTSPETKQMLAGLGIELISYRDLQS